MECDSESLNIPQERNLVCVLFPGVVKNVEKALQCLGGIRNISQVYSQTTIKKRLALSFQPENPCVKKVYGDCRKGAGILIKVKVKKTKIGNEVKKEMISSTVVGRVTTIYRFESLCDFQYMPVAREGSGPLKCFVEQMLPSGIDPVTFLIEPCPLYVVPASFTRTEKPTNYSYTNKRYYTQAPPADEIEDNVHNKRRIARSRPYSKYEFSLTNDLPTEPCDSNVKQLQAKIAVQPQLQEEYNVVEKLFKERPIWSLNLIKYETKIPDTSLKMILPCLAIYMRKGPWKMVWTRFGYDPRKDPKARIYQSLDFRVRNQAGVNAMVTTRLAHYHKKLDEIPNPKKCLNESSSEIISEGTVYFRPGIVPTQRQVYYQYCDIQVPEVQELLEPEPAPGYLCHQTRGWLQPNMDQLCRDHIFRYVKEAVLATHQSELKLDAPSSDDDSTDDDTNEADGVDVSQ